AADPAFRLIESPKLWDRGAALTSTLHWVRCPAAPRQNRWTPRQARPLLLGCWWRRSLDAQAVPGHARPHLGAADAVGLTGHSCSKGCSEGRSSRRRGVAKVKRITSSEANAASAPRVTM